MQTNAQVEIFEEKQNTQEKIIYVKQSVYLCIIHLKLSIQTNHLQLSCQLYINSLLRRPSKTAQPLVRADRPKPPSKITVRGPFVYRDLIPLLF